MPLQLNTLYEFRSIHHYSYTVAIVTAAASIVEGPHNPNGSGRPILYILESEIYCYRLYGDDILRAFLPA